MKFVSDMNYDQLDKESFEAYKKLDCWGKWPRCSHLSRDYEWKNASGVVWYECPKLRTTCSGFNGYCSHYKKPSPQLELNFDID